MWSARSQACFSRLRPQRKSSLASALIGPPGRLMRVVGSSMLPRLRPGDLVLVRVGAYARTIPRQGDVVAARPVPLGGKACVKRIAGLPHQTIRHGTRTWHLAADEYFLLGDRPEDSLDSRAFGPVKQEELIGRVWLRVWPPARLA